MISIELRRSIIDLVKIVLYAVSFSLLSVSSSKSDEFDIMIDAYYDCVSLAAIVFASDSPEPAETIVKAAKSKCLYKELEINKKLNDFKISGQLTDVGIAKLQEVLSVQSERRAVSAVIEYRHTLK